MPRVTEQAGYDAMASVYDTAFPTGYASIVERHAVALFVDEVAACGQPGPVVDVGCGAGHIAHDLAARGLDVVGLDPSAAMLALAKKRYPEIPWRLDDARLEGLPVGHPQLAAILARFSLIHADPATVPNIFAAWATRLLRGAHVLVAFQCSDDPDRPVIEFDHRVARAWRWHPDAMAAAMEGEGFIERWRLVTRPDDSHRFAECHLLCRLAA